MKRTVKKDIQELIDFKTKRSSILMVDLACGNNKVSPEWLGIDYQKLPAVDIVHNLEEYPWPLPDACANTIVASHYMEHINPAGGGVIKFMDECWRILKEDGELGIAAPYGVSYGFVQDPTHTKPINEATFFYFDPLHPSDFYKIYHPKPWRIKESIWHSNGNIEVILVKRKDDPTYYADITGLDKPQLS